MGPLVTNRNSLRALLLGLLLILVPAAAQAAGNTPLCTFRVVRQYPHDPQAFTQGLAFRDGFLYEGTGLKGQSSVRKVSLETGQVVLTAEVAPQYFGEGITLFKNELIELTWQAGIGFVYDSSDFHLIRRFSYPGEGWGLASDGCELFMSDGTDVIRVLDPVTFAEKRRIRVRDGKRDIEQLNELEFVEGEIFANVWHSDKIARISPKTGMVVGWIDLTGLLSPVYRRDPEAVLNGIAYDPTGKRLFVTGKLWPRIFEIQVIRKER